VKRALVILAIVAAIALSAWQALEWAYYRELNQVRAILASYPGVQVIEIDGNHDIGLEDLFAVVQLDGGGSIRFGGLTEATMPGGDHVYVDAIGPYTFATSDYGILDGSVRDRTGAIVKHESYGGGIDIGAAGPYAGALPIAIHSPKDAIDHYDALIKAIASWPDRQDWKDARGNQYRLFVIGGNHLARRPSWEELRIPPTP
jgi:hypothetical protein